MKQRNGGYIRESLAFPDRLRHWSEAGKGFIDFGLICALGLVLIIVMGISLFSPSPSTQNASAANAACRNHGGVQQVQSGLFSGTVAVCKDGVTVSIT